MGRWSDGIRTEKGLKHRNSSMQCVFFLSRCCVCALSLYVRKYSVVKYRMECSQTRFWYSQGNECNSVGENKDEIENVHFCCCFSFPHRFSLSLSLYVVCPRSSSSLLDQYSQMYRVFIRCCFMLYSLFFFLFLSFFSFFFLVYLLEWRMEMGEFNNRIEFLKQ